MKNTVREESQQPRLFPDCVFNGLIFLFLALFLGNE